MFYPKKLKPKKLKSSMGQILIELIIAIGLGTIIIASIFSLFVDIGQANLQSLEQTQGEKYVGEGVEALHSIREKSWNDLVNQTYPAHPVNNGGVWALQNGSELLADNFTRQITIADVFRNATTGEIVASGGVNDPSTKKFTITVTWSKPRPTIITKEIYLTRYLGNANWTETLNSEFGDGTAFQMKADNDSLILDNGEGQGGIIGNRFSIFGTDNTDPLDDENKKVSFRFSGQNNKTARAIKIYIHDTHSTQTPTYRYGIQSNNAGKPTGTWLGATNHGYADFQTNDTGWHEITLGENVDITQGQIYHLVVEYQSGQINSGKKMSLRTLNPLNRVVPLTGTDDLERMILWSTDNGSTWTDVNETPIFVLLFTTPTPDAEGNPYHIGSDADVYGDHYKGEIFKYTPGTEFFDRLAIYVKKKVPAQPQDDLWVTVRDMTTDTQIANQLFITREEITTDYQLKEITLNPTVTFVSNHEYRFHLYSNGTAENRAYQIEYAKNVNESLYNLINYLGLDAKYTESNNAGAVWTTNDNADTMFRFNAIASTGYFSEGTYESSTFDAGSLVSFNRILWTETINPGITNVEFQIAVNSDGSTWNYVGPDGTPATRFTNPDGQAIPLAYTSGRYFRYKVYMTTTSNLQTPTVYDVTVNYSP